MQIICLTSCDTISDLEKKVEQGRIGLIERMAFFKLYIIYGVFPIIDSNNDHK